MAMVTRRLESMSTNGYLQLIKEEDGDIVLTIAEADAPTKRGVMASCEFCTSGGGSSRTLEALYVLMGAMAEDNLDESQSGRRPRIDKDEQQRIVEWVKTAIRCRKEIEDFGKRESRVGEFYEKLGALLKEYGVTLNRADDYAVQVSFGWPILREDHFLALDPELAVKQAEEVKKEQW